MPEVYNIYCDESCHLEHDGMPVMVLGAVWCPNSDTRRISQRVGEIKRRHAIPPGMEIKWTKVSPAKQALYLDLVDYFFDEERLHFRCVLIHKTQLDHPTHNQTHDTWYYKMCFTLLEPIIDPEQRYRVYLDIKDTRSEEKRRKLEEVLRNSRHDSKGCIIERVQQIRSHESQLMQLADLLIGAIAHHNRGLRTSAAKLAVIERIRKQSGMDLEATTWLREPKFNMLNWCGRGPADA